MPVFEVLIIEHPKKKKDEEEGLARIVVPTITLVAKDGQQAAMNIVMDNADKLKECDRNKIEVLVRPFA